MRFTLLVLLLTGCAHLSPHPNYPIAGPAVAAELEEHCFPIVGDERQILCPATAEWLGRLHKLKNQLNPDYHP